MKRKSKSVVIPPLKLNNTSVNALADAITSTSLSTTGKTTRHRKKRHSKSTIKDYRPSQLKRKVKLNVAALHRTAKSMRRNELKNKRKALSLMRALHSGLAGDPNYVDLRKIIIDSKHGISYNPKLITAARALQWVKEKKEKNPQLYEKFDVISGDFDNDVETPDNVIVRNDGKDLYVDGYQIVPGRNKVFKQNVQLEYPLDKDRRTFYAEPNYLYLKKFFRKPRSEISKYSSSQEWYTQDQTNNPQRYKPDTYLGACVLN
jgi:hypothetical protein